MEPNRPSLRSLVMLGTFFVTACAGDRYEQQVEILEKRALMDTNCVPTIQYSEDAGEDLSWINHNRKDVRAQCMKSLRLVASVSEIDASFRRYRCRFDNKELEVSLSAAKSPKNSKMFTWCEFAASADFPLEEDKVYTSFRRM